MLSVRTPRPSASVSTVKVHRPAHQPLRRRRQGHALADGEPLAAAAPHLQTRGPIQAMHTFVVHDQPVPLEQDVQPPIAKVRLTSNGAIDRACSATTPKLVAFAVRWRSTSA